MSRNGIEQFRITPPLVPETTQVQSDSTQLLPNPRVIKTEFVRCASNGCIVGSGRSYSAPLPPDALVHELLDADLGTSGGVVSLLATLGLDLGQPIALSELGLSDRSGIAVAEGLHTGPFIVEGSYLSPRPLTVRGSCGPGVQAAEGVIEPATDECEWKTTVSCGPWQQVAQRLRLVRAAIKHFVAHQEHTDVMAAWSSEGFEALLDHRFRKLDVPLGPEVDHIVESAEADAWRLFVTVHAQLLRDHLPSLTVWLRHGRASLRITALPSSVPTALMVQLHNLIVDGLKIRRCANETCGRPFTRQRGRARKGQYRNSGVIYCDAACGKAQMQREYRRRNRQRSAARPEVAANGVTSTVFTATATKIVARHTN